ncbi:MAG: cupin domain-containing protein [Pseudomonadota bacterium]|nr:cupin domain-containing protein [Pseudomonadota bacterium]
MLKNDSLDLLHEDMRAANMAPTWKYISDFVTKEPRTSYRPWLWRWNDVIPLLMRAGDLITPERGAERRSMEHHNPDLPGSYSASHTIATAFQLVRAGERAPAHRHMAGAIRFAAKSRGGAVYTRVEGEPLRMEENDLVLTPSWTWHEHENETEHDIVWLDALDFPLVNLMQASLFEPGEAGNCPPRPGDFSERRLGLFRPSGWGDYPDTHPVLRYPWADMRAALLAERDSEGSPYDGIILEYVNPTNSGPTLPTMTCHAQLLRAGEDTLAHRMTTSTVVYVISGVGTTVINGIQFDWSPGDVFVIPTWAWHEHRCGAEDAFLFSITDRPALAALGMVREQPFEANGGRQTVTGTFDGK